MLRKIRFFLTAILTVPHLLCYLLSKSKSVIQRDIDRWTVCAQISQTVPGGGKLRNVNLMWLLVFYKEYRNLFYLRIGELSHLLCYLPRLSSLYIDTPSVKFGAGTFIQHGFSTMIAAKEIGEDCWINQQVTIGFNDSKKYGFGQPTIGNNVRISAGAKVIGNIKVGDDSTIGVNAVVVKDVPSKSTVVPSPMMLIRENGEKVYKKL